ncbi:MAG: RNA-binding S4 domain-containing protein [Hyphomicrobiaceae bacterium]|nr:RNA-binding S4 domain-containing protein [Hyphomicrobiaceae bacterium]
MNDAAETIVRIRLDKWLWHARIVKTRTLAQKLIEAGDVRVNGTRVTQSAHKVGPGMTLTIAVAGRIRVLEILGIGARRGPAPEAEALYLDLSPIVPPAPRRDLPPALREPGAGRPTKKERRDTDRLRS